LVIASLSPKALRLPRTLYSNILFAFAACRASCSTKPSAAALENGLLPPVSDAMKHEEQAYLEALKTFSQPTRDLCKVSRHRRKQFQYSVVKEAFGFIEEEVGRALHEIGKSPID